MVWCNVYHNNHLVLEWFSVHKHPVFPDFIFIGLPLEVILYGFITYILYFKIKSTSFLCHSTKWWHDSSTNSTDKITKIKPMIGRKMTENSDRLLYLFFTNNDGLISIESIYKTIFLLWSSLGLSLNFEIV